MFSTRLCQILITASHLRSSKYFSSNPKFKHRVRGRTQSPLSYSTDM